MALTAKQIGEPGKGNFSPINQPQLIIKSWVITNKHFIKSHLNELTTTMNFLSLFSK